MKLYHSLVIVATSGLLACEKKPVGGNDGWEPTPAPYSEPLWHPSGTHLGYNYRSDTHPDSTGYYLIGADGSGKTKVLDFPVHCAQWSRDGRWLAYSVEDHLYKVPFTGTGFDLTQAVQLTQSGRNYFPAWNDSGDSLVYDSNLEAPDGGYRLWKMAADGSGKTVLAPGRMPLWKGRNIYFVGRDQEGSGVLRLQSDVPSTTKVVKQPAGAPTIQHLKVQGTDLFYQLGGGGIYRVQLPGGAATLVGQDPIADLGYDISTRGQIAYVWYSGKVTPTEGVIWVQNRDGSGKTQLTFNRLK